LAKWNHAMTLTEKRVRELGSSEREYFTWDDELPGFGVRVRTTGAKSYVLKYRIGGGRNSSQRRSSIGKPGVLSLADARAIARDHLTEVARGNDPFGDRKAKRSAPSVNDLLDRFLTDHAANKAAQTQRQYKMIANKVLRPALGKIKVAEIQPDDLERLHRSLKEKPAWANRVLAVASKAFSLAERWRMREPNSNPCRVVDRYREEERTRVFSASELAAIGKAVAEIEDEGANPGAVLALRLAALLGFRISEICSMRWKDIEFERGVVVLPKTKIGRAEHTLPSSAMALLTSAERVGECVVPGRDPDRPLDYKAVWKVWARVVERAELEDAHIHDLRRTLATEAAGSGAGAMVLRDLLGHKTVTMANRYAQRADASVRDLRERVSAGMAARMRGEDSAEVVRLPRK